MKIEYNIFVYFLWLWRKMIFGYGIQRESGWCELFSVLKFAACRALSETARLQALTVTLKSGAFCTIRVVPRFYPSRIVENALFLNSKCKMQNSKFRNATRWLYNDIPIRILYISNFCTQINRCKKQNSKFRNCGSIINCKRDIYEQYGKYHCYQKFCFCKKNSWFK